MHCNRASPKTRLLLPVLTSDPVMVAAALLPAPTTWIFTVPGDVLRL